MKAPQQIELARYIATMRNVARLQRAIKQQWAQIKGTGQQLPIQFSRV